MRAITLVETKTEGTESAKPVCYPSIEQSYQLLRGLWCSPFKNWKFSLLLGLLYALAGITSLMWSDLHDFNNVFSNAVWLAWGLVITTIFIGYADRGDWIWHGRPFVTKPAYNSPRSLANAMIRKRHWLLGAAHGLMHISAMTAMSVVAYNLLTNSLGWEFWTWWFNVPFIMGMMATGGLVAGSVFAFYLYVTCRFLGLHANDALSAQSLDRYRGFLRLCISPKGIEIYSFGIDQVLQKRQWKPNNEEVGSKVMPIEPIDVRLIETPLVISVEKTEEPR